MNDLDAFLDKDTPIPKRRVSSPSSGGDYRAFISGDAKNTEFFVK
jgi:hypothetical protein